MAIDACFLLVHFLSSYISYCEFLRHKQKALLSSKQDPKKGSWNEFRTTIKSAEAAIRKFHRKTPEMESLFNSVAGLKVCNFITRTCEICEIFKNTLFYVTLEVTASESGLTY